MTNGSVTRQDSQKFSPGSIIGLSAYLFKEVWENKGTSRKVIAKTTIILFMIVGVKVKL